MREQAPLIPVMIPEKVYPLVNQDTDYFIKFLLKILHNYLWIFSSASVEIIFYMNKE